MPVSTASIVIAAACTASVLLSATGFQPVGGAPDQKPGAVQPGREQGDGKDGALENSVRIEVHDGYRYITSNGIPDHERGAFPNRGNPNSVRPQKYSFRVPEKPTAADKPTALRMQPFGVAVNGIVFDPGTAEWYKDDPSTGWHMEAIGGPRNLGLDFTNAHVQPSGAYHYHGVPSALMKKLAAQPGPDGKPDPRGEKRMILVGWAADGFPIYGPYAYSKPGDASSEIKRMRASYTLRSGERAGPPAGPGGKYDGAYEQDWLYAPGSGDLDECGGRTGVTPEFPAGTYYYVLTDNYPFIPRMFHGTPDRSFDRRPPPGTGPGRGRGGPPGRPPGGGPPPGRDG